MHGPQAALLDAGQRLHLHHGPIDLIIGAEEFLPDGRQHAFKAAYDRFQTLLEDLAKDLNQHRRQLTPQTPIPTDPVAQRMYAAALPFCTHSYVTLMIAVAGSVADEILTAMCDAVPLRRAYVNNGGDISVHLSQGQDYCIAMGQTDGGDLGRIRFAAGDGIGGIATSGTGGRSHSMGIADSVTVLAATAAQADVAATLISNAVDVPGHGGIIRQPACDLQPDSDLGARLVVVHVPALNKSERDAALVAGHHVAQTMLDAGQITGAALFLQGQNITIGCGFGHTHPIAELENV
jgi:hypothetical protein